MFNYSYAQEIEEEETPKRAEVINLGIIFSQIILMPTPGTSFANLNGFALGMANYRSFV